MNMEMNRPHLGAIYMRLSYALADRSTCKRLQCGCVIASEDLETIYAIGYNGSAKGLPNDECREEMKGNCGDIHAEVNAIAKVGTRDKNKVFFLTGEPCETCAKLIINSGASKVYYGNKSPYRNHMGLSVLYRAKVKHIFLPVEEWK